MDTAAAPAATTYSTAIRAQDFSNRVTDANRDRWTAAKLDALIPALDGVPVALIVDRQTGFAEVGVKIVGTYDKGMGHPYVTIERTNGTTTSYWAPVLGDTIIPLEKTRAKWDALKAHRAY